MTPLERAKKLLDEHEDSFMEAHLTAHFEVMAGLIAEAIREAIEAERASPYEMATAKPSSA